MLASGLPILFFGLVFVAIAVATVAGFGLSLILMPLAVMLFGLSMAAPLVALLGLTLALINSIRIHQATDWRELRTLVLTAAVGVPLGVWWLGGVDERLVTVLLGGVLVGYGLYTLLRPTTLHPISRRWSYPMGFLAGCLAGAYNIPGPPLILYGSLRQWSHAKFRAVLQTFLTVSYTLTLAVHIVAHRLTLEVLTLYVSVLPALLLGILAGSLVYHRLDVDVMRLMVNGLIIMLGISLLFL
jgi:uncharacterized protein